MDFFTKKNLMGDDVIVISFKFLQTIVYILKSFEPTNFILGTNIQQNEVHTMIKATLTDGRGHR